MPMVRDNIMPKLYSRARWGERIYKQRPPTLDLLVDDIDIQDILSINLERAVQVTVDIGAHIIAGLPSPPPKSMGEVFDILVKEGIISTQTGTALRQAVGFRNLSVHAYDAIEWERVFDIVHQRLDVFRHFSQAIVSRILP